ncbi:MAG: signal recognition particle subunit SRP19/SEC65 family protein [Candidatus Kariarchaeaceae archaeon]|jgi:signal recognition particle subunit SRP19
MLRRKRFYVIYPEYFDKDLPRNKGRRVSLDMASDKPTLNKIVYACKKLELEHEVQEDKSFPARWWNHNGRVLLVIDRKDKVPKSTHIDEIAKVVRRLVPKKAKKKVKKGKSSGTGRTPPVR